MTHSIKYWTGKKCVILRDYLVMAGTYYIPIDGRYYMAESSRVMAYAGTTSYGGILYENDIIEWMQGGICYRSRIVKDTDLNVFMVEIMADKRRVLGKFLQEHPESIYIANDYENKAKAPSRNANVIQFPLNTPSTPSPGLHGVEDEPLDDSEIVSVHIASSKVNDGEECGPAKWAYILMRGAKYEERKGETVCTANRAYLMAVINALSRVKKGSEVHLYTKSKYVTEPFIKGWLKKWQDAGWLRSDLTPVQNVQEWKRIAEIAQDLTLTLHWVDKRQQADAMQMRCDSLIIEQEGKKKERYA